MIVHENWWKCKRVDERWRQCTRVDEIWGSAASDSCSFYPYPCFSGPWVNSLHRNKKGVFTVTFSESLQRRLCNSKHLFLTVSYCDVTSFELWDNCKLNNSISTFVWLHQNKKNKVRKVCIKNLIIFWSQQLFLFL